MSTIALMQDPGVVSTRDQNPQQEIATTLAPVQIEVELIKCECCNLTEECTPRYIESIRESHHGKWLCGLCAEAIKDEILRNDHDHNLISIEEAVDRHIKFRNEFTSSSESSPDPTVHLISTMRQVLRRSIDSPRGLSSTPSSPTKNYRGIRARALTRSESCLPTLSS